MTTTVQDVMTRTVVVATPDTPFKELVRSMDEHRVSALPVVDTGGRLVGVVSEGDLVLKEDPGFEGEQHLFERRAERRTHRKAAGRIAAELMTAPVVTVTPTATLAEAAHVLRSEHVKRLPVVDDAGHMLGIVSRRDLLAAYLRADEEIAREIREEVVGRTLWLPPDRVSVEVEGGVVRLAGTLERRSLVPELVRQVRAVVGVVGVETELSWEADDTEMLLGSLARVGPWM